MHDLHDLLARGQAVEHVAAHGALAYTVDELLDDGEVDIGLEQREADLAHGLVDVVLGQATLAPKAVEGGAEPVGKGIEHPMERRRCDLATSCHM